MKAFLGAVMFALVLSALPAAASHERGAAFGFRPGLQAQKGPARQFKGEQPRDARRERRAEREERSPGRLTEDERRELHRDLDKANRELYRRRFERR